MPPSTHAEVRPRTTGEILDDAGRLFLADVPLLLAASGLFLVPAACALIVLLTQPAPDTPWQRCLWPALTAVLLPLTGLGAGACQEAFHLWAEGRPAALASCLRAALRRGLNHVTGQGLVLLLPVLALVCLTAFDVPAAVGVLLAMVVLLLSLPIWLFTLSRHVVLTSGQKNLWRALRAARRASGRQFGKAAVIVLSRLALLGFALLNLHLLLRLAFWTAEELAGLDVAYLRLLLALGNPIYLLALAALVSWLLTPYNEAVNYLFSMDARTRYEGLDLWYRLEQLFPLGRTVKAGAVMLLAGAALLTAGPVHADARLDTVRGARKDLAAVTTEVKTSEPYPGGQFWRDPLDEIGQRLDPGSSAQKGRYRWYFQAVEQLGEGDRTADLNILKRVDDRLALVEASLQWQPQPRQGGTTRSRDDIKNLVPPGSKKPTKERREAKSPPAEKDQPPRAPNDGEMQGQPQAGPGSGVGLVAPQAVGGLLHFLLFVFAVLLVAALAAGIVLLVRSWRRKRPAEGSRQQGVNEPGLHDLLDEPDRQNVASLWRQSDELARTGRFLDAVRTLYLAVLALLHQAHLIRYERTRTNGEYADQLRPRGGLHGPFLRLTGLFEVKWYGERSCQEGDYRTCRGLAEDIQQAVGSGQ